MSKYMHAVDKKRLAQAIEAYKAYDGYSNIHNFEDPRTNELWNDFYSKARYCCHGDNVEIASLIYNCNSDKLSVDTIYYAIVFMGYNIDYCTDEHKGDEYYEHV